MNEIDKIIQQGQQFYQDTADLEGRGHMSNYPELGEVKVVIDMRCLKLIQTPLIQARSGGATFN